MMVWQEWVVIIVVSLWIVTGIFSVIPFPYTPKKGKEVGGGN